MTRERAVTRDNFWGVEITRETAVVWDLCVFALCNLSYEGEDVF